MLCSFYRRAAKALLASVPRLSQQTGLNRTRKLSERKRKIKQNPGKGCHNLRCVLDHQPIVFLLACTLYKQHFVSFIVNG